MAVRYRVLEGCLVARVGQPCPHFQNLSGYTYGCGVGVSSNESDAARHCKIVLFRKPMCVSCIERSNTAAVRDKES